MKPAALLQHLLDEYLGDRRAPKHAGHPMVLTDRVRVRGGKRSRRRTARVWERV